jgi:transcriptional regulator with XRE-family HTH domain
MKTKNALHYVRQKVEKDPQAKKYYEEYSRRYDLAEKIREMREAAGLTQKQLADKIGTKQSGIARLEDPDYESYSLATLKKIAHFFKKELIIGFEEPSSSSKSKGRPDSIETAVHA